jgi:hypothetical protein
VHDAFLVVLICVAHDQYRVCDQDGAPLDCDWNDSNDVKSQARGK